MGHVILGTVAGYVVAFIAFALGAGLGLSFLALMASGTVVALGSAIWSAGIPARKTALEDKVDPCGADKQSAKSV